MTSLGCFLLLVVHHPVDVLLEGVPDSENIEGGSFAV
jgi:hypothetical protein